MERRLWKGREKMLEDLAEAVQRYTEAQVGQSPYATEIPGLLLLRSDYKKPISHIIYKPALCMVIQGAKWAMFGSTQLNYRAGQALMASLEMPGIGRVVEASPSQPYLGLILQLDPVIMREVMEQIAMPGPSHADIESGMFVLDIDRSLADCALRLVRLLGTPDAIPILSPLIMREIYFWLLTGPHGSTVAKIGIASSHAPQIMSALHLLRDRFAEPVRIEDLARAAHLSPSAFHRQFKAFTLMTPLQFQKQLRLLEARRLMAADAVNVEAAAFQVGYESPSQFSREYSRMFGAPPRRDVVEFRASQAWSAMSGLLQSTSIGDAEV